MKIFLFNTVFSLLFIINSFGQTAKLAELRIGDACPDVEMSRVLYYSKSTIKLSDFKGKLVILDFWNVHCLSCIKAFPKMEALQEIFKDQIQIILVTRDSEEKVRDLQSKVKVVKDVKLPIVIEDKQLIQYFPNRSPHHAWIGKDGRVKAIAESFSTNKTNIQSYLSGKSFALPLAVELENFNPNSAFFDKENNLQAAIREYSYYSGYVEGITTSGNFSMDKASKKITRMAFYNNYLLDLYKIAFGGYIENANPFGFKRRIIFELTDSSRFIRPDRYNEEKFDEWHFSNSYCYEISTTLEKADNILLYMQDDLKNFFGVEGRIEKHKLPCLTLVKVSDEDKIHSKGVSSGTGYNPVEKKYDIRGAPMSELIFVLTTSLNPYHIIIDKTGYENKIDISLGRKDDLASYRTELQKFGLDLIETEEYVDMLILKKVEY